MPDNSPPMSAGSYLKTLRILYYCFLASQIIFVLAVVLSKQSTYFSLQDEGNVLLYMTPFLGVAGFLGGKTTFENQLDKIAGKANLKEKTAGYSTAFLIRVAFMEFPTLFGAIAYLRSGNLACLVVSLIMILYFLTLYPSRAKVEEHLTLSFEEKTAWENPGETA